MANYTTDKRTFAVDLLWTMLWIPYGWAGDDFSAFDCSGQQMEILQAVGIYQRGTDKSADGIYEDFKDKELPKPYKPYSGCLIFWFSPTTQSKINPNRKKAVHIAMFRDNLHIIHASGGGRKTKTTADAIKQNAYIKPDYYKSIASQRLNAYGQRYKIIDPFKE